MTNYPTQLDEINQWLFDSFGIVAGACSSTENLRYNTAKMVAEALLKRDQVEGPSRDQVDELEKAAKENAKAIKTHWIKTICIENFISGANWQREQLRDLCYQCEKNYDNVFYKGEQHAIKMMKEEAIVGEIVDPEYLWRIIGDTPSDILFKRGFRDGDLVKVYIFKDDKE